MNCFSLDLETCNLNNSGIRLIKSLFFSDLESLFLESRNSKMETCGVKVGNTNLKRSIYYNRIHKTCVKVVRRIIYRRKTVEKPLFLKFEVSY